jgi:hypothetical protein
VRLKDGPFGERTRGGTKHHPVPSWKHIAIAFYRQFGEWSGITGVPESSSESRRSWDSLLAATMRSSMLAVVINE